VDVLLSSTVLAYLGIFGWILEGSNVLPGNLGHLVGHSGGALFYKVLLTNIYRERMPLYFMK
jgi:hypothetical protein